MLKKIHFDNLDNKLFTFVSWLLCLIVPSLITGPFIPDLFLTISIIIFVYFVIKKKFIIKYINNLVIFFFIWCVYLIINSLFSSDILISLESSLFYFRFGLFVVLIYFVFINNPYFIKIFLNILIASLIILLLDSFFQYFIGYNLIGYEYNNYRLSSFFGDELVLGSFLIKILPILISLSFFYDNSKRYNYFITLLIFCISLIIFLSGERTAFFHLVIYFSLLFFLLKFNFKIKTIFVIIFFFFFLLITLNNENIRYRMFTSVIDQINYSGKNNNNNSHLNFFSYEHNMAYKISLDLFKLNPFFGIGPKMYRIKCKNIKYDELKEGCTTHPHNIYIQLLSETGIIGVMPLLILFFYLFYSLFKQALYIYFYKKEYLTSSLTCLYLGLFVNIFPISPSGNIFNNWYSILMYLPIGFIFFFRLNAHKYD